MKVKQILRPWERRSGGYRKDEDGNEYYLSADQLDDFIAADKRIESDGEFWDWFKDYREARKLRALPKYNARGIDDWSSKGWGSWSKTNTKDWWQSSTKSGMSWASGNEQRLAIVIQQVASVVGAVDESTPPMVVRWKRKNEQTSFTDFERHIIAIDPTPVIDNKTDDATALDVVTGFALHESGHSVHTRPLIHDLDDLGPASIAMLLGNVLEDIRLERLVADEWPGFAEYFPKALEWAWSQRPTEANPAAYADLGQKLNAVIVIGRWRDKVRSATWTDKNEAKVKVLADASFDAEIPWWSAWCDDYIAGRTTFHDAVKAGLEHLADDPEFQEREKNEGTIMQVKDRGQEVSVLLRKLIEELKLDLPCAGDGEEGEGLEDQTAETVQKLADDKLREHHFKTQEAMGGRIKVYVSHPTENEHSKRAYKPKQSPVIQKLKSIIQLRPELPRWSDRLRRTGDIDEDELYRFGLDDYRIFEQKVIEHYPSAQVTLLVDGSGSMHGGLNGVMKVQHAQELARLFVEALRTMEGITPKVVSHTANTMSSNDCQVYQIWEPGEPVSRLGLITTVPSANNYDGYAIAWCVEDLIERGRPDDERLLIVLSDGQPSGSGYGGHTGMTHMRKVVDSAERNRVAVVQIAIDDYLDAAEQSIMFKHWVPFTTAEALPVVLQRVVSKALNQHA